MQEHPDKVDVEVVVGPDSPGQDLHPDPIPESKLGQGRLGERVVLVVVGVVAAGDGGRVVSDQDEAVVTLDLRRHKRIILLSSSHDTGFFLCLLAYRVGVEGEQVGSGGRRGEEPVRDVHAEALVDVARCVRQVAGRFKYIVPNHRCECL